MNAYRLPCCDQSICETCTISPAPTAHTVSHIIGHSTLPSTCPVCEHSPVSATDCKPNKSLRTTIKVFLRTEEKKRESARTKETQDSVPATPVVDVPPTPVEAILPGQVEAENAVDSEGATVVEQTPIPTGSQVPLKEFVEKSKGQGTEDTLKDEQDVPHATIEVRSIYHYQ